MSKLKLDALRAPLDGTFKDLHSELQVAYYNHWKHGNSHPWLGYDVQSNYELSKSLFNRLHASLYYFLALAQRELQDKTFPGLYPIDSNDDRAQTARRVMKKWDGEPPLTPLHDEIISRLDDIHPSIGFKLPWQ